MPNEIITIGIGNAGIKAATKFWELICAEHQISNSGKRSSPSKDETFRTFFEETNAGQFVPRSLLVDLDNAVIDDVKNGQYAQIFHPEYLLAGKEDAAHNFARGRYSIGSEIINKVNDRIRKLVDNCDNVQGFIIFCAVGGGTGSGLGSLILERLSIDYRKKSKMVFAIYPSPTMSQCIVEPYNALLSTHWLLDHSDITFVFDNEALFEYCQKKLNIKLPTEDNLNELIAYGASGITTSLRFEGELNTSLDEFQTNLRPFPRLHFMTVGLAGFTTEDQAAQIKNDVQSLTEEVFSGKNFLTKVADFDPEEDKYMAISLQYRGSVKSKEANATVQWLKANKKVTFVDWSPTGFKIGLEENQMPARWTIYPLPRTCIAIGNNTLVNRLFSERVAKKYDLMYSQRAYVHWYVNEGMEEGEFAEAREKIGFLVKDYMDVLQEKSDEEDDEENVEGTTEVSF